MTRADILAAPAIRTIDASSQSRFPDLRELWEYRSLFRFLVWRDIRVRYAQTVLGAGWAILQPILTMIVFTMIFGKLAKLPSDGAPYAVFSLAALVPWTFFAAALANASNSVVANTNLVTKIYFPRVVIPVSAVLAGLIDLVFSSAVLIAAVAYFGITPTVQAIVVVPILVLTMVLTACGVGAWLAALNLKYRDVKYVVPFLMQIWMYASPIVYPASLVPAQFRRMYDLNPMVGVIEGFRAAMLGTTAIPWTSIGYSFVGSVTLFVLGLLFFKQSEYFFADLA